jgi:protein-disulfide isomerase
MTPSFLRILHGATNGALVVCALIVTYAIAQRFLIRTALDPVPSHPRGAVEEQEHWESLFSEGQRIGRESAPVGIVVFSDYECPACLILHDQLRRYEQNGKLSFGVLYRHWPLGRHRFAEQAGVASECAAAQGRFRAMHDSLFANQPRLGAIPWRDLAAGAGVRDLREFERCLNDPDVLARVKADAAQAQARGFVGTPTVILAGGMRFAGVPAQRVLDSLIGRTAERTATTGPR